MFTLNRTSKHTELRFKFSDYTTPNNIVQVSTAPVGRELFVTKDSPLMILETAKFLKSFPSPITGAIVSFSEVATKSPDKLGDLDVVFTIREITREAFDTENKRKAEAKKNKYPTDEEVFGTQWEQLVRAAAEVPANQPAPRMVRGVFDRAILAEPPPAPRRG
jgi:hypothetical protein